MALLLTCDCIYFSQSLLQYTYNTDALKSSGSEGWLLLSFFFFFRKMRMVSVLCETGQNLQIIRKFSDITVRKGNRLKQKLCFFCYGCFTFFG
jgi:hypothetical protein